MTTDKTWKKKCMADAGLVYSVITWTLRNCLCPRQWEAADWGNLGHGRATVWAAEQDWHSRRRKLPAHKAHPLHRVSLPQERAVTSLGSSPCTAGWQGPLAATSSAPSFPAGFMMTVFLPDDSFTVSFCLSIFYHCFSKGWANLKLSADSIQSHRNLLVPVCPWNGHREGNSKGSFSMHCPTWDAEYPDLQVFSHKDTRALHYLVAPLGCSVRATASSKGGAAKGCQLGWHHLAKDTAQRPFAFTWIWEATLLTANNHSHKWPTDEVLHISFLNPLTHPWSRP